MVSDIPQLNALFHGQFFLCHHRKAHIRIFPRDLILQIIADAHKEGLVKGHGRELVVDPVCAGHHPHRRHHKGGEHCRHFLHALSLAHKDHHIAHKAGNTDCLDQKPGDAVIECVFLDRIHIAPTALDIFFRKILLFSGDLHLFNPLHGLGYPLK